MARKVILNTRLFHSRPFSQSPKPSNKIIKIGYISSFFTNTSIAYLTQSLYHHHDRTHFEVYCYATSQNKNNTHTRPLHHHHHHYSPKNTSDKYRNVTNETDENVARIVHDDGITVLVTLDGYSSGARNEVLALRPAPIQILLPAAAVHCCSMGGGSNSRRGLVDYVVADEKVLPHRHRASFRETIVYMPHCFVINSHRELVGDVVVVASDVVNSSETTRPPLVTRADYGLSEDVFAFACFSEPHKIDPELFDTWIAKILDRTERSVLVLVDHGRDFRINLWERAELLGVDPSRIVFVEELPQNEHVRRIHVVADVVLDTRVCSGDVEIVDALWSGTPVVTIAGGVACRRVGVSLLAAVGLEKELVVDTEENCGGVSNSTSTSTSDLDEYADLAVALCEDEEKFIGIIRRLEEVREAALGTSGGGDLREIPVLFDTARWVRSFESGVKMAVEIWNGGNSADDVHCEDMR